ncbi:MAG: SH3 domain-containing protein [Chloroflexota bacterium]
MAALAPYKVWLVLAAVLVLILVVAYVLISVVMSFFGERRPDPSSQVTPAGPVLVPTLAGSPVIVASPSPAPGTAIGPAASPTAAAAGVRMKVANTDGQGANMRQRPSTTAPVLRTLPEGTSVEAIGGETNAEGRNWRNIREANGQTGWIASELLAPE